MNSTSYSSITLCNALSVIQSAMDNILHDLIGTCEYVCMDDIVVYSEVPEQYVNDLCLGLSLSKIKTK